MAEIRVGVRLDAMPFPLRKKLETAARMGAQAVELDARNDVRASVLTETGIRQLNKMLGDYNLRVAALRFQTRRGYDNPSDLERRIEATKATMKLAYQLGCNVVINNIGHVPETEDSPC